MTLKKLGWVFFSVILSSKTKMKVVKGYLREVIKIQILSKKYFSMLLTFLCCSVYDDVLNSSFECQAENIYYYI